jgi:hypothetical protein
MYYIARTILPRLPMFYYLLGLYFKGPNFLKKGFSIQFDKGLEGESLKYSASRVSLDLLLSLKQYLALEVMKNQRQRHFFHMVSASP